MNKIICDLCGTAYPQTASQCPICGTAKSDSATPVSSDGAGESTAAGYAYVRGGRFSHSNVRKRNTGKKELPRTTAPAKEKKTETLPVKEKKAENPPAKPPKKEPSPQRPPRQERRPDRKKEDEPSNNIGLIIIVVILVLAIIAVCAYIAIKFIDRNNPDVPSSSSSSTQGDIGPVDSTPPATIPCTSVALSIYEYSFKQIGEELLLNVRVLPEDTTDSVTYSSGNDQIATVDSKGKITAVADGEVIITVQCGNVIAECLIICDVGVTPPPPSTSEPLPTEPQPTDPPIELKLNRSDFSLSGYGSSHNLYNGEIDKTQITWTSSNEEVATVTNGKVVAVGNGKATITAEYMGQKVTCIVRCRNVTKSNYKLSSTDITVYVGKTATIQLLEIESGLRIQPSELKFSTSSEGFFTVDEEGKITAIKSNYNYYDQYVIVEYNGETFKCVVRVRNS